MVIGALVLGMIVGLGTATIALFSGYSIWMALCFYSLVGAGAALLSIGMIYLIRTYLATGPDESQG